LRLAECRFSRIAQVPGLPVRWVCQVPAADSVSTRAAARGSKAP
jgi:hypothetical protein